MTTKMWPKCTNGVPTTAGRGTRKIWIPRKVIAAKKAVTTSLLIDSSLEIFSSFFIIFCHSSFCHSGESDRCQAIFFFPIPVIRPDLRSTGRSALYIAHTRTVEITALTNVAAVLHFARTSAICCGCPRIYIL